MRNKPELEPKKTKEQYIKEAKEKKKRKKHIENLKKGY